MVQRGHNFVIVDEVDSILIDEARTPLIISGPTEDRSELYKVLDATVRELIKDPDMFELDEKQRQVLLSELGSERLEEMRWRPATSPRTRRGYMIRPISAWSTTPTRPCAPTRFTSSTATISSRTTKSS
ncbi:MAG: hypothetical protein WDN06_14675 [Asticcacaulis sp.]